MLRHVRAISSVSFWVSVFRNRLERTVGLCVKRSIIFLFTFLELWAGIYISVFYHLNPEVSLLGWGFNQPNAYVLIGVVRALQGFIGVFAVRTRKVTLMRHYVLFLPISTMCTLAAVIPLMRLNCCCSDFWQCHILRTFDTYGKVANVWPQPPANFPDRPGVWWPPPKIIPQDWCLSGYQVDKYCCAHSCGTCSTSQDLGPCELRPGGPQSCCKGDLKKAGRRCVNNTDTACIIPTCPDSNGVIGYIYSHEGYWGAQEVGHALGVAGSVQDCAAKCNTYNGCHAFCFGEGKICHVYRSLRNPLDSRVHTTDSQAYTKCKGESDSGIHADDPEGVKKVWDPTDDTVFFGTNMTTLLSKECTCAGPVFQADSDIPYEGRGKGKLGGSCKHWNTLMAKFRGHYRPGLDHGTIELRNWCYIRHVSLEACQRDPYVKNTLQLDTSKHAAGHYWTSALCRAGDASQFDEAAGMPDDDECACSKKGMRVGDFAQVKPGMADSNNKIGDKCGKWLQGDETPWCFVGFDSSCSDKQHYTLSPTDFIKHADGSHIQPKKLIDVSQFKSHIPCDVEEGYQAAATRTCVLSKNGLLSIVAVLSLTTVVMIPVICLFVQNRCGDMMKVAQEFEVDFSSSSDEDFDIDEAVVGVDPGVTEASSASYLESLGKKPKKNRKSVTKTKEANQESGRRGQKVEMELADMRAIAADAGRCSQSGPIRSKSAPVVF